MNFALVVQNHDVFFSDFKVVQVAVPDYITVVTSNRATENFRKIARIRQFSFHFSEITPFLDYLSSDFGSNKAFITIFEVTTKLYYKL